eukprot:TRINITY_DN10148_c0_g1_i2.p1 TRINITY_DN10148_c0_g1~~TRINITY_DN10148_c0_g1_i2.p1  ORF type:complete len:145 (-),score=28.68 TRINITY_DN10148_c0_g1_i2:40-474(-)
MREFCVLRSSPKVWAFFPNASARELDHRLTDCYTQLSSYQNRRIEAKKITLLKVSSLRGVPLNVCGGSTSPAATSPLDFAALHNTLSNQLHQQADGLEESAMKGITEHDYEKTVASLNISNNSALIDSEFSSCRILKVPSSAGS